MTTSEELAKKGTEVRSRFSGGGPYTMSQPGGYGTAPGLEAMVTEALFGGIWARPQLDIKHRSIVTISALTALGWEPQLKGHIRNGLNLGLTPTQIVEVMVHLVFYASLPAALNGLRLASEVFGEREEWKKAAPKPEEYGPRLRTLEERRQQAAQVRRDLWGTDDAPSGSHAAAALAPEIYNLVVAYNFGEVYRRPGLDYRERLLATIAALTVTGMHQRLPRYVQAALRVGLTRQEVVEAIMHTAFYGGMPAATEALERAREVL